MLCVILFLYTYDYDVLVNKDYQRAPRKCFPGPHVALVGPMLSLYLLGGGEHAEHAFV